MLRVGLKFEVVSKEDRRLLDRYLLKLRRRSAWQRLTGKKPMVTALPPEGAAERRQKRRVRLEARGELIALVESVNVQEPDGSFTPRGPALEMDGGGGMALTGRLMTYNIEDITTDGCSFLADEEDDFPAGAALQLQVVGEELSLSIFAKIVETAVIFEDEHNTD